MEKLFPQPYLPSGSKGAAVVMLQALLYAFGYNAMIIADGDYGEETIAGVKALQNQAGIEEDGHFGPDTRKAFLEATGIDVNEMPAFKGETVIPAEG